MINVSSQESGGDGVFAGGFAARKHPAPQLTEMNLINWISLQRPQRKYKA
jgi:hypothetical protein